MSKFALKTQIPRYLYDEQLAIEEIARGFGVPSQRVEDCAALDALLPRALAEPGPHFLELVL